MWGSPLGPLPVLSVWPLRPLRVPVSRSFVLDSARHASRRCGLRSRTRTHSHTRTRTRRHSRPSRQLGLEWYGGVFLLLQQRSKHPREMVITPKASTSLYIHPPSHQLSPPTCSFILTRSSLEFIRARVGGLWAPTGEPADTAAAQCSALANPQFAQWPN